MQHQINDEIRDREVLVIDADGTKLGIMPTRTAMEHAMDKDMDLVKIAPQATPPVCRIMDYGKFRFEQAKKEKEARRHQHIVEVKEIRLSPGIDDHDFEVKLRSALRFLQEGDKVKASVRFRGREMAHTSIGEKQLRKFAAACSELANTEKPPKLEGRSMTLFLSPKAPHVGKDTPKKSAHAQNAGASPAQPAADGGDNGRRETKDAENQNA